MKSPSHAPLHPLLGWLLASLLGAICALWLTYPAWLDLEHVLVGDWRHPDVLSNHWLYGWLDAQLASGGSILHNDRYYFPVGDAPYLAGNGGDGLLYAALGSWGAWPGSVTLWLLAVLTANTVVAWGLCRRCGASVAGALLGAAVLGSSAYLAHELSGGRFAQVAVYPLLGFVWACIAVLERPKVPVALLAAIAFALCCHVYWYYGLWALVMGVILLAARLGWGPGRVRDAARELAKPVLAFAVLVALAVVPLLLPFLGHWQSIPGIGEGSWPHPLAVEASLPALQWFANMGADRAEVIPSLLAVIAAGAACARMRVARTRDWRLLGLCVVGVVFFLLSLGPRPMLLGGDTGAMPGPFGLVYGWAGPLKRFWWPYRHVVGVLIPLAVLAARGADLVLARLRPWQTSLVVVVLVLSLPLDVCLRGGRVGAATSWWEPPPAYTQLARLEGQILLELPLEPSLVTTQQSLTYQQQVHGKTLVNGHAAWVDRVRPEEWERWTTDNSFLKMLRTHERGLQVGPFAFLPEDVYALRDLGVRYLVVNREYLPGPLYPLADSYRTIFGQLFGDPVYTFRDHLLVWDLRRYSTHGFAEVEPFRIPQALLVQDGSNAASLGHARALGLRGLSRAFPPQLPPEQEPVGAVE